ncbi:hypothetical protein KFK09_022526 [Dendrobium nobile]|uniref:Uncharacterized protein n=1 Tax=Dendrobium nobile TaxID=94219 RepID=A0A8T3AIT8_DENNO|nr:hypothetical protein KFK09_022526 [Dendrobium nobile]
MQISTRGVPQISQIPLKCLSESKLYKLQISRYLKLKSNHQYLKAKSIHPPQQFAEADKSKFTCAHKEPNA